MGQRCWNNHRLRAAKALEDTDHEQEDWTNSNTNRQGSTISASSLQSCLACRSPCLLVLGDSRERLALSCGHEPRPLLPTVRCLVPGDICIPEPALWLNEDDRAIVKASLWQDGNVGDSMHFEWLQHEFQKSSLNSISSPSR